MYFEKILIFCCVAIQISLYCYRLLPIKVPLRSYTEEHFQNYGIVIIPTKELLLTLFLSPSPANAIKQYSF